MKVIKLLTMSLLISTTSTRVVGMTSTSLLPQDEDRLTMWEVNFPGQSALDGPLWDWSDLSIVDEAHEVSYRNLGDTLIVRFEGGMQHHYAANGDSYDYVGCESPHMVMIDSLPAIGFRFPLSASAHYEQPFYLHGSYCGNNAVAWSGTSQQGASTPGTLILPGGDTIVGVTCVTTELTGAYKVGRGPMMAAISNVDTLPCRSLRIKRWYSSLHRYALAQTVTETYTYQGSTVTTAHKAYIYPPSLQEYEIGETVQLRETSSQCGTQSESMPDEPPVGNVTVNVDGGSVSVAMDVYASTDVQLIVSDLYGRAFITMPRRQAEAGQNYADSVDVGRLPTGDYLLHIQTGEQRQTHRFSLR